MDRLQQKPTHLPSLLVSVLFALSGLFLLGISFLMGFAALIALFTGQPIQAGQTIFFVAFVCDSRPLEPLHEKNQFPSGFSTEPPSRIDGSKLIIKNRS